MDVDFKKEIDKRRKENVKQVRKDIKSKGMQTKIDNYARRYELERNYVEQLIMDDIMYALNFAKDPGRQSIHENIVATHLEGLPIIKEEGKFRKLPSGGRNAKYVNKHGVGHLRVDSEKSIDFEIEYRGVTIYATCKYTKEEGGAQDNQYHDVRNYIINAVDLVRLGNNNKEERFIAIVDGDYYERRGRKENLKNLGLGVVEVLSVNEVEDYLKNI